MYELQFIVMMRFDVSSISCAWFLSDSRLEMAEVVEKMAIRYNAIHLSSIQWVYINVQF